VRLVLVREKPRAKRLQPNSGDGRGLDWSEARVSLQPTPRPTFARGMALACILFLLWRAAASVQLNVEEFDRPLGTRVEALRWSEAQRIDRAVRKVEQQAELGAGYLAEILAAIEALPSEAQVWILAGKEDRRRRGLVRLQHLWHPRRVKAIEVLPRSVAVSGEAYLIVFGPIPERAAELTLVQRGADWSLLGP